MKKVTPDEYKDILFDVLKRIDTICKNNKIEYCLFYGAVIGAVRHGGFIPWDDDIDLVMKREEYDKLREVISSNPESGLRFIDIETNENTIYTFAKVCDCRTRVIDKHFIDIDGYGAFIDIFPFDYLPENKAIRWIIMHYCKFLNRLRAIGSRKKPDGSLHGLKYVKGILAYCFTKMIRSSAIVKRIDKIGRKCSEKKSSFIGIIRNPREVYPYEWVFPTKDIIFRGASFCGPREVDKCLTAEYGDYMQLPPEEKRIPHHIECWFIE